MITYEKTIDPNIIKQIETSETNIRLDSIQQAIDNLQAQIDEAPCKTKPDQETLDFWNEMNGVDEEMLLAEIVKKKVLLAELTAVAEPKGL